MPCGECPSLRPHRPVQLAMEWAAISSGAQGSPGQGRQERWEAGRAKFAWTASDESLLAGLQTQDPGQGQEQDMTSAWSRLRIVVTDSTAWRNSWAPLHACQAGVPSCATEGMDEPEALLLGQGPAVCHRPPPCQNSIRDSSKLVITSVLLSWIRLSWLVTVMHRGSSSCPTLYFSTSSLTVP